MTEQAHIQGYATFSFNLRNGKTRVVEKGKSRIVVHRAKITEEVVGYTITDYPTDNQELYLPISSVDEVIFTGEVVKTPVPTTPDKKGKKGSRKEMKKDDASK